jgi:hypothetical protein
MEFVMKGSGFTVQGCLNSEPQNIEYRISKCGIARAAQALPQRRRLRALSLHLFVKIDRIHSFDIRYSLFYTISTRPKFLSRLDWMLVANSGT